MTEDQVTQTTPRNKGLLDIVDTNKQAKAQPRREYLCPNPLNLGSLQIICATCKTPRKAILPFC
jgi:hypothetical protein